MASLPNLFEGNPKCHSVDLCHCLDRLVLMPSSPQYGGNIVKAHVGRWSEDCPEHQAVVVYSMDDTPLVSPSTAQKQRQAHCYMVDENTGFWRYSKIHYRGETIGAYGYHLL